MALFFMVFFENVSDSWGQINLKLALGGYYEEVFITTHTGTILHSADFGFCGE
jgi:hypothetical protein